VKIAIVLASHRRVGKNREIEDMIRGLNLPHSLDFIRLAEVNVGSCTSCYQCADKKNAWLKMIFKQPFSASLMRIAYLSFRLCMHRYPQD